MIKHLLLICSLLYFTSFVGIFPIQLSSKSRTKEGTEVLQCRVRGLH